MTVIGRMEYERIKKSLWSGREFRLSTLVLPNGKTANNTIKHGIYERSYESKKYTDRHELSSLDISVGEYYSFEFIKYLGDGGRLNNEIVISHNKLIEAYSYFVNVKNELENNFDAIYTESGISPQYAQTTFSSQPLQSVRDTEVKQINAIPYMVPHPVNTALKIPGVYFIIGNDPNYGTELDYNNFINLLNMLISITEEPYRLMTLSSLALIEAQNNQIIENQLEIIRLLNGGNSMSMGGGINSNVNTRRNTNTGFNRSSFQAGTPNNIPQNNGITNHTPSGSFGGGTTLGGRRSGFPMGSNINRTSPLNGAPQPTNNAFTNNNVATPTPAQPVVEDKAPEIEKSNVDDFANTLNTGGTTSNGIPSIGSILEEAKNTKFDLDDTESVDDLDL